MTPGSNNARNFTGFSFSLHSPWSVVRDGRDTYKANDFREFWVTVTFEGSHIKALRFDLAIASNKEVK